MSRAHRAAHAPTFMHEPCFPETPSLVQEIDHAGTRIRVAVWCGTTSGPGDTGFGIIRDIGLDPGVRGFPVLKAEVDSTGCGYANIYGWLQVIAHINADGSVGDWGPDSLPALRDRGVPFCSVAYHPTFYDAPFWPERPQIHWRADLFLCPIVVRRPSEEDIVPVAGFRWGFKIAQSRGEPELLPLKTLGARERGESLPRLKFQFPSWRFGVWSRVVMRFLYGPRGRWRDRDKPAVVQCRRGLGSVSSAREHLRLNVISISLTMAADAAAPGSIPPRDRIRLVTLLLVVVTALVVATLATQVWLVEVELPQQIHDSQPVVVNQAALLDDGPYLGCFDFLASYGGAFHQGSSFVLSWNVACPTNATTTTIQSIDGVYGPVQVSGSNLPVTIQPGQTKGVEVSFAPVNEPYWGGVTVSVVVNSP